MAKATGVGGVFLRAKDPAALVTWYTDVLGLEKDAGGYTVLRSFGGETLTWAVFPADTDYFGSKEQTVMVNYPGRRPRRDTRSTASGGSGGR